MAAGWRGPRAGPAQDLSGESAMRCGPRASRPAEAAKRVRDLWERAWDTLDLPVPAVRRFASHWQWLARLELRSSGRLGDDASARWLWWGELRRRAPDHPMASEELGEKLRRWMELAARVREEELPEFPEVVALRALHFVDEIEQLVREGGDVESLALALGLRAVLLGGSLARPEEAERVADEIAELGEGEDGWRVRAAVEQLAWFFHGEGAIDLSTLWGGRDPWGNSASTRFRFRSGGGC